MSLQPFEKSLKGLAVSNWDFHLSMRDFLARCTMVLRSQGIILFLLQLHHLHGSLLGLMGKKCKSTVEALNEWRCRWLPTLSCSKKQQLSCEPGHLRELRKARWRESLHSGRTWLEQLGTPSHTL